MWIKNTLDLVEVECSAPYLDEARGRSDLEIIVQPRPIPFDARGNLPAYVSDAEHLAGSLASRVGA
jgi:hypothetical protein